MVQKLVAESVFISPDYASKIKVRDEKEECEIVRDLEKCVQDTLPKWLGENAFPSAHYGFSYLFIGENGAHCLLYDKEVFSQKLPIKDGEYPISYKRSLTIRFMPVSKGIPQELRKGLESLGYREL